MQVTLKFFNDDATGEWGVAHENSIDRDEHFNAFWGPVMIFHDVFEHYFEGIHPYFSGDYAFNIAGEVAAMGHLIYYYYCMHAWYRLTVEFYSLEESIITSTQGLIEDAITYGYTYFGNAFKCRVLFQKYSDDYTLENIITEHLYRIGKCRVETSYPDERESAIAFKKSLHPYQIANLYRWGFNEAAKIAPYEEEENRVVLEEFFNFWKKFCSHYKAEELQCRYDLINFHIYHKNKLLCWNCEFQDKFTKEQIPLERVEDHLYEESLYYA